MASSYPGSVDSFDTRTTGQVIAASHVNDLQNAMVAVQTYAAKSSLVKLANGSGAAVAANDCGYIDEAGEFQTTTTEALGGVAWCVVVEGGANGADIIVARRGQATIELDQNCSAGDYLYTSTTAGRATTETFVKPAVFAVALTANSSGAGGTCDALLLCGRIPLPLSSDENVFSVNGVSESDWRATQNGAVAGAVVTYNTPLTSGSEDSIEVESSGELGKLVLHNTTQGETAYISSVNTGANTITVTNADDISGWANNDVLEVRSQTNTTALIGTAYYLDLDITSTTIPALATAIDVQLIYKDTGGTDEDFSNHPYESNDNAKRWTERTYVANINHSSAIRIGLINRRFCVGWTASGAGTALYRIKVAGCIVATP